MRRVMMINKDTLLKNTDLTSRMIDEIMRLKEWYIAYRKNGEKNILLEEDSMLHSWNNFINQKYEEE